MSLLRNNVFVMASIVRVAYHDSNKYNFYRIICLMDFHGLDLNLLAAFDALMKERNVTRAAVQMDISQPAMSAALSRLRKHFGDPLFRRSADGLLPTPRAWELAEPIAAALRQLETALVKRQAFNPQRASLTFSLGLSDYASCVLLPWLAAMLEERAPGVALNVQSFNHRDHAVELLDTGRIDAAIGVLPTRQSDRIQTRPLLEDKFVTIVRHDHPAARRGMNKASWLQLSHLLVSPEGDRHGLVDRHLTQQGHQRKLALTLPDMSAAPAIVARTHMAATILRRVALDSPARRQLVLFSPPIELPAIAFHLLWHRRNDAQPGQRWLRERITELADGL